MGRKVGGAVALPEACRQAQVPYARAWHLITAGLCPSERRGGRLLVEPAALREAAQRLSDLRPSAAQAAALAVLASTRSGHDA